MEDARFVSNYVPNGMFESSVQQKMNIKNNEDYRRYLTNNARRIMQENAMSATRENMPFSFLEIPDKKHGPYIFESIHATTKPPGYELSNAKSLYLSRQQLASQQQNRYKNTSM
jgi:hypothetical protein